jgi:hypothetical protein
MTELSNAVTVLIARMESHPEDFKESAGEPYPKFAYLAIWLRIMCGGENHKDKGTPANPLWHMTETDKEALKEAYRNLARKEFEGMVMRDIFDDGSEERERQSAYNASMQKRLAQQAVAQQQAAMNSYPYVANSTGITSAHTGLFGGIF